MRIRWYVVAICVNWTVNSYFDIEKVESGGAALPHQANASAAGKLLVNIYL